MGKALLQGVFGVDAAMCNLAPQITILIKKDEEQPPATESLIDSPRTLFATIQDLPIRSLKLQDGDISWPAQEIKTKIKNLALLKKRGELAVEATVLMTEAHAGDINLSFDQLQLSAVSTEHKATIKRAKLKGVWGTLKANGVVWGGLFEGTKELLKSEVDLAIRANLQLAGTEQIVQSNSPLDGNLLLNGDIKGRLNNPKFSGKIAGTDISIGKRQLPPFSGTITASDDEIKIQPFIVRMDDRRIALTGTIQPKNKWELSFTDRNVSPCNFT